MRLRLLLPILLLMCVSSPAQDASLGALRGVVVDPTGVAVSGAAVRLTSEASGLIREAVTDSNGAFSFRLLPPGQYTLRATVAHFVPFEAVHITLEVGANAEVNVKLSMKTDTV